MKKRIITSVVITVIFALIIVTSSFITLVNINIINDAKEALSIYNVCFSKEDYINEDLSIYKFKGNSVRFTVINKEGGVIFDNETSDLENHKDRQEIIDAFHNGTGSSVRFSKTLSMNMVYYATKINDNIVIRSSVPVSNIKVFTSGTLKYYVVIVIVVFLLSLALSVKLVKIIVYPIKELEQVTAKIANGNLNKRALIGNYDEIGLLAQTFNNMADQLETKINDSLDKQNKLEAILESMESGVIAVDNNEKIILSNPYSKKLFDLQAKYAFNPSSDKGSINGVNYSTQVEEKFALGKCAMIQQGNWIYGSVKGVDEKLASNVGMLPIPLDEVKTMPWVFMGYPTGFGEEQFGPLVQKYFAGELTWNEVVQTAQKDWAESRK